MNFAERARQQAIKLGVEVLMMQEGVRSEFRNGRIFIDLAGGGRRVARPNVCAKGIEWCKALPAERGRLSRL